MMGLISRMTFTLSRKLREEEEQVATRKEGLENAMKLKVAQLKEIGVVMSSSIALEDEEDEVLEPIVIDTGMFSVKVKGKGTVWFLQNTNLCVGQ